MMMINAAPYFSDTKKENHMKQHIKIEKNPIFHFYLYVR